MQKAEIKLLKIAEKNTITGILKLIVAFLLGAAKIGDMRPFGVSFAAASKEDGLWRFAGAFLGSLLVDAGDGGILYAAAVMICFACRMVFRDTKAGKNRAFLPISAGLSVILIKGAGLLPSFSVKGLLLLIFEGALCFAAAVLFSLGKEDKPRNIYIASIALTVIGSLFAFEPMEIMGFFSLARIASALTVIGVGYFYGSGAGAGVGVALGALADMSVFSRPHLALVYSLGGLLCGGGKTSPRFLRGAMWIIGTLSALIWCGGGNLGIGVECVLCGALVCITPERAWSKIEKRLCTAGREEYGEIKPKLSEAIEHLGDEIAALPPKRKENEMQKVLDRAADGVCSNCSEAKECWRYDYTATGAAFLSVGAAAKEKSEISKGDFPKPFAQKCVKLEQLCKELNRQLRASRSRQGAAKRKEESSALMKRQYEGMSGLFKDAAAVKAPEGEASLSARIDVQCRARGGESQCGDSFSAFVTEDMRQIVLLSDGMGSGSGAASASKKAIELLSELIRAGAGLIAAAEATAPVLEAKFESMGFVTLDALQIDLRSGESFFVKYGACPSYILRGERSQRVWQQSLPAGLGGQGAVLKTNLKAGDRIVMVSDGVKPPQDFCGEGREICLKLMDGQADDDKTAAVISLGGV